MQQMSHTALLVMDVQNGIVERFATNPDVLAPFQKALAAAREADIPVIFVRVAFRPGFPEVSPRNKSFSAIRERGGMTSSDASTQIHASVAPRPLLPSSCNRSLIVKAPQDNTCAICSSAQPAATIPVVAD